MFLVLLVVAFGGVQDSRDGHFPLVTPIQEGRAVRGVFLKEKT